MKAAANIFRPAYTVVFVLCVGRFQARSCTQTVASLAHTVRTDASVANVAGVQNLLHVLEQYVESLSTRRALVLSLSQ